MTRLSNLHILLALAIVAIWGSNFVVIKLAIAHLPPLFFACLRFTLVFFPLCLFLKRPAVPLSNLAGYGLLIGVGQFGLVFLALKGQISPGITSLVLQLQVFVTIGYSVIKGNEKLRAYQYVALGMAVLGLALIAYSGGGSATPLGLAMIIGAAFSWGFANVVSRAAGKIDMLAYVVWAAVFAVPPLLALSLVFEGWQADLQGLQQADAFSWAALVWQSVANTMFGYGAWAWLLARYPSASVAPMALLVPIFGMSTSAIVLGEPMEPWKLAATALVLGGLALNLLWPRLTHLR
ncbi:MAG: EamA family transporter [Alphaproteobacteria bacterium]|nr:EamA family transporter [Alphaproteobacteria bacterium]